MSQANSIRLKWETERSLGHGSIIAGFTAIGTPFAHEIRQIIIQNQTDVDLQFSFDGINNNITLFAGAVYTGDFCANKTAMGGFFVAINTTIYVRAGSSGNPTTGGVFVAAFYGAS